MGKAKKKTERICKKCRQPVKGHIGLPGWRNCQNSPTQNSLKKTGEDDTKKNEVASNNPPPEPNNGNKASENSATSQVSAFLNLNANSNLSSLNESTKNSYTISTSSKNSTVNPDKSTVDVHMTPKTKAINALSTRVADIAAELQKLTTEEPEASTPYRGRVRTPRKPGSITKRYRRSRRDTEDSISPISVMGRSERTALDHIGDIEGGHRRNPPTVPGLRQVPPGLDVSRLQAAVGLQERLVRNTLEGELANLPSFVDEIDCEDENIEIVPENGQFRVRQKSIKRKMSNFNIWLQAWHNYERLMVEYHGIEAYNRMSKYKITILEFSRKYHWEAVERFDRKHRKNLSRKSIDFSIIDNTTQSTHLNLAVINMSNQCDHCKTFDHNNHECPMQNRDANDNASAANQQPFQKAAGANAARRHRGQNNSNICYFYNSSKCTRYNCRKWHVCSVCGGNAPYSVCSKFGFCSKHNPWYQ